MDAPQVESGKAFAIVFLGAVLAGLLAALVVPMFRPLETTLANLGRFGGTTA